eukprot:COSAG06_NODE_15411_length_1072_cov_2.113052_1_plen_61_part_10
MTARLTERLPTMRLLRVGSPRWGRGQVRKTPFLASFLYKNDHFTKTGSGQTQEKVEKMGVF